MPGPGFKPGPHWWEASAPTTVPPLLLLTGEEHKFVAKQILFGKLMDKVNGWRLRQLVTVKYMRETQ